MGCYHKNHNDSKLLGGLYVKDLHGERYLQLFTQNGVSQFDSFVVILYDSTPLLR
jgi:hypothetical protein